MAKATQKVFDVGEISTRKTVMTIGHHLYSLFRSRARRIDRARRLVALLRHLSTQALRAHPARDRSNGSATPRHSAGDRLIAKYLPMHAAYRPLRAVHHCLRR